MTNINKENIKIGLLVYKEKKKFIILKVNTKFFYYQEIGKQTPKFLLDAFQNKPRKYKLEEYCKDVGVKKGTFLDNFTFDEKEEAIVSLKENKTKTNIKECCAKTAVERLKHKNKSGKSNCKKCQKEVNVLKIENEKWLTFSQDLHFYMVNIESFEILPFVPPKSKKEI